MLVLFSRAFFIFIFLALCGVTGVPAPLVCHITSHITRVSHHVTSQDGSLRKKEVLDNTGDAMVLSDAGGKEIAVLEIPARCVKMITGVVYTHTHTHTHGYFCVS